MNLKLAGILAALALGGGAAFAQSSPTGNMPVKGEHMQRGDQS